MANSGNGNGRDRLDAQVAGQKIGLTTNNLVAVVFIGLIGLLLWMFWGSGQVIMQRDIVDRHRIAEEHKREHAALRQDMERYHITEMERQLEIARAWMRVLGWMSHNLHVAPEHRLPFGAIPPGMEEQLKKQLPVE